MRIPNLKMKFKRSVPLKRYSKICKNLNYPHFLEILKKAGREPVAWDYASLLHMAVIVRCKYVRGQLTVRGRYVHGQ